ncbi:bifunctional diguanylate cyclase/phosphodiesterase [Aurantimonas sp. Leaf443]|uniref:putative bifunctional diguanylate cyclase/phosphodiesterase n=1 Tax=Aurantimonas sp. Leaf443 TaxID=1736378 RepID=UPI0006F6451C|nr:bifunctional diguanylate cyclase/phosphodiesterase [Aurantimonas sp. Leaf443]KQT85885.1 hypothetical protein ASG48_04560 [Aurantimonas sp. Leaf443]
MKLTSRALLLIFPVVLTSYALAAMTIYMVQRDSVQRLEETRLRQQLSHLSLLYSNDETINRGLLELLVSSSTLRVFVQEADTGFRSNALSSRLEETIRQLSDDPQKFISFALYRTTQAPEFYFENSSDPFAEISLAQLNQARALVSSARLSSSALVDRDGQSALIVSSVRLDPVTMGRPVGGGIARAITVQTAIRPARFLQLRQEMEREYGAKLEISTDWRAAEDGISASAALGSGLVMRLTAPASYTTERLDGLKLMLCAGTIVMSLLSICLLILLVRRFIIHPVSDLDRQVTEVMQGQRGSITISVAPGEVQTLAGNVKRLHDDVASSLRRIGEAALTDTLTGISNRAHFNILAAASIEAADADGSGRALLFIDVDNFKFVNDRYGHEAGDELLAALAARIEDAVRRVGGPDAIVARLSGDEFAVMLRTPEGIDKEQEIADAILSHFERGFDVSGERFPVAVSIGIASYPGSATSLAELVADADAAMYQAKARGKNRAERFGPEISAQRSRARQIQTELRRNDPDQEFRVVYMPTVDALGRVSSCEALIRWTSPRLGAVGPDEFVPIAERNGLFSKIDRWMVDRALRDHRQLQAWFGRDLVLCVNLSSAELHGTEIHGYIAERMAAYGVEPRLVELELTETVAVGATREVTANVAALRASGVRIAIDDFGAGYTSVQQIIEYSADTIKLDRFFLERIVEQNSQTTLDALVALCHAQGLCVVAEGVDTARKQEMLASARCDLFQGYGISPPRSLEDLGIWALGRASRTAPAIECEARLLA